MPSVPSGEQNTLPFGRLQSERGELPVPAPSLNPRVSTFTFTLPSPSVALIKLTHLQIMLTRHALPQHECTANVFVHGACDNSTCTGIEYCHLHAGTQYACWEVTPSAATASMVFTQLRTNDCGYCTSLLSHYPCESCCGDRASASWSGSYITTEPDRKGGGVFMEGSWWVCLLMEVAAGFGLANAAAGLEEPLPPVVEPPSPPPPLPDWPALLAQDQAAAAELMPESWNES